MAKLIRNGGFRKALAGYVGNTGGGGGDASTLNGQAGTYYLDRANHTGTQLAATISDFAAAVAALSIDADTLGGSNLAAVLDRTNHTGTQLASTISDFAAAVAALSIDAAQLGGQLPAYYLDRANHTGTQLAATISDFAAAVNALSIDADTLGGSNLASVLDRANHTGTQLAATISDFAATVNALESSGIVGTPGNTKYYGTDGTGVKGFFDFPAIGAGEANFQDVVRFTSKITPAALTASTHDYNPAGLATANVVFISATGNQDLTGIAAQEDGRVLFVQNYLLGGGDVKLKNNNANSLAANRFLLDADVTIKAGMGVTLIYSTSVSRWLVNQVY